MTKKRGKKEKKSNVMKKTMGTKYKNYRKSLLYSFH